MKKDLKKLKKYIKEMNEWWKSSSQNDFEKIGAQLLEKGFTVDEAYDILNTLLVACINEYGD